MVFVLESKYITEVVQTREKRKHIVILSSFEVSTNERDVPVKVKPMSSNKSQLASVSHPRDGKTM